MNKPVKKIIKKFTDHPASINETYIEHLKFSSKGAFHLIKTSLALLSHGVFPFLFTNYARDNVGALEKKLLKRNPKNEINVSESILDFIGKTPMLHLNNFVSSNNSNIFVKCEMFNPTLSIKDRIVLFMLKQYEMEGKLKAGYTIYEASSGNTGSSLAMIASVLGYKTVITVPAKTSQEKIDTMKSFGAEVIICKGGIASDSPEHYTNKAFILSKECSESLYFNQYGNVENVNAHYYSTALEIWQQMDGNISYFIAPASSGGTISGVGKFLKQKNPNIKIIMPDPVGSIFYDYYYGNELNATPYQVEGAGKDKVCSIHDFEIIDEVIKFTDEEAFLAAKKLALTEGVLSGGSSGGALAVAEKIARKFPNNNMGNIVVMLPDSGFKYLSKFYSAK